LGITVFFYRTVRPFLAEKEDAFLLALLYFSFSSKFLVLVPEFTQMAVWSFTLVFLMILRVELRKWGKLPASRWMKGETWVSGILIGTGISCMVLAYPSMVLVAILFAVMLFAWKEYKHLAVAFVTILIQAGGYIAYLASYLTVSEWVTCIRNMLYTSGAHDDSACERILLYGHNVLTILLILGIEGVVAFLIYLLSRKKITFICCYLYSGMLFQIILWVCRPIRYHKCYDYTILFLLLGYLLWKAFAVGKQKESDDSSNGQRDQMLLRWQIWAGLSGVLVFIATALLTNLPLFVSIRLAYPAILLAGVFALARLDGMERSDDDGEPIEDKKAGTIDKTDRKRSNWRMVMLLGCFTLTFIRGFSLDNDDGEIWTIRDLGKVITEGPEAGLVTTYMKGYMQQQDWAEWQQYIQPGDSVLIVDFCTIPYLFEDVDVASYTTISTPTYNDGLEIYYRQHPEKYPDVVVLSSWYGELTPVGGSPYITEWVEREYQADQVIDGSFYRYYKNR
ncbi:MAG: hypothetical protein K6A92_05900, partial [Lachnospiraceae bacterium]|nr:hypothetical protein [Lachnospiraceae bacterium]